MPTTPINPHHPAPTFEFAVYREERGEILAFVKHAEDAAALLGCQGDGAMVCLSGPEGVIPSCVLWLEGPKGAQVIKSPKYGNGIADGYAYDGYDEAADVMRKRAAEFRVKLAALEGRKV